MIDLSPAFHPRHTPIPKGLDNAYQWRLDKIRGWLLKSRLTGFAYSPEAALTLFTPISPANGPRSPKT